MWACAISNLMHSVLWCIQCLRISEYFRALEKGELSMKGIWWSRLPSPERYLCTYIHVNTHQSLLRINWRYLRENNPEWKTEWIRSISTSIPWHVCKVMVSFVSWPCYHYLGSGHEIAFSLHRCLHCASNSVGYPLHGVGYPYGYGYGVGCGWIWIFVGWKDLGRSG